MTIRRVSAYRSKPIKNYLAYTASDYFKEDLLYLQKFGVSEFTHDITFSKGEIALLCSNQQKFKFYYEQQFPMVCANDAGRNLKNGFYYSHCLKKDYHDYDLTYQILTQRFAQQSYLHIAENANDCQHLYTFASFLPETEFLAIVLNNINVFQNYVQKHKNKHAQLIHLAQSKKQRICLPYISDTQDVVKILENSNSLLAAQGPLALLTAQQKKCVSLLLEGCTHKEIAQRLALSPRTIEHYLKHVANKYGLKNSKAVFQHFIKIKLE